MYIIFEHARVTGFTAVKTFPGTSLQFPKRKTIIQGIENYRISNRLCGKSKDFNFPYIVILQKKLIMANPRFTPPLLNAFIVLKTNIL